MGLQVHLFCCPTEIMPTREFTGDVLFSVGEHRLASVQLLPLWVRLLQIAPLPLTGSPREGHRALQKMKTERKRKTGKIVGRSYKGRDFNKYRECPKEASTLDNAYVLGKRKIRAQLKSLGNGSSASVQLFKSIKNTATLSCNHSSSYRCAKPTVTQYQWMSEWCL